MNEVQRAIDTLTRLCNSGDEKIALRAAGMIVGMYDSPILRGLIEEPPAPPADTGEESPESYSDFLDALRNAPPPPMPDESGAVDTFCFWGLPGCNCWNETFDRDNDEPDFDEEVIDEPTYSITYRYDYTPRGVSLIVT